MYTKETALAFFDFLMSLNKDGYLNGDDPNLVGTPQRMARMYHELLEGARDTSKKIEDLFQKRFPSKYIGIVAAKDIKVTSVCPHHFLPVNYTIDIGYIPKGQVVGVSKLHRVCKVLAARAVLQEDLTYDIIENMKTYLSPNGAMVIVEGLHGCMTSRGIKQENPIVTSQIYGDFTDGDVRNEFLALIGRR
jgi:GTP cyclohydrolase I